MAAANAAGGGGAGGVPGFNASGRHIVDPSAYLDYVLMNELQEGERMLQTDVNAGEMPSIAKSPKPGDVMLPSSVKKNAKSYQTIPFVGLARVASSPDDNHCWFDSFLTCISKKYNMLNLQKRDNVVKGFRKWCSREENLSKIIKGFPKKIYKIKSEAPSEELLRTDISTLDGFIDARTGFAIAWFFGVNCIYIHQDEEENIVLECQTSYQSPDCKVVFIYHTGNHFEPIGLLSEDDIKVGKKYKVENIKFLFQWNDPALCNVKYMNKLCGGKDAFVMDSSWEKPTECGAPSENTRAMVNAIQQRMNNQDPRAVLGEMRAKHIQNINEAITDDEKRDAYRSAIQYMIQKGDGIFALTLATAEIQEEIMRLLPQEYNKIKRVLDVAGGGNDAMAATVLRNIKNSGVQRNNGATTQRGGKKRRIIKRRIKTRKNIKVCK